LLLETVSDTGSGGNFSGICPGMLTVYDIPSLKGTYGLLYSVIAIIYYVDYNTFDILKKVLFLKFI